MIAAGVNAETLSTYMGHANIKITLKDTYGHLMPGNEQEAAGPLADTGARLAQLADDDHNEGA